MSVLTRTPHNTNYLQPTKFLLSIDRIKTTQYFCQTVNLPGVSLGQASFSTPLLDMNLAGTKINYNPLNIKFTIDEEILSWKQLYAWFLSIASPKGFDERNTLSSLQSKRISDKNYSDATLIGLSALNNPVFKIHFLNIFPTSLSDIDFDTSSSADTIITADAAFHYESFEFASI
jgi:hypothetical protein